MLYDVNFPPLFLLKQWTKVVIMLGRWMCVCFEEWLVVVAGNGTLFVVVRCCGGVLGGLKVL